MAPLEEVQAHTAPLHIVDDEADVFMDPPPPDATPSLEAPVETEPMDAEDPAPEHGTASRGEETADMAPQGEEDALEEVLLLDTGGDGEEEEEGAEEEEAAASLEKEDAEDGARSDEEEPDAGATLAETGTEHAAALEGTETDTQAPRPPP